MDNGKNRKIDDILSSLDGAGKATAPDFFYTRLKARMEKEMLAPAASKRRVLQPAFAFVALFIILLVNAVVILGGGTNKETVSTEPDMQAFASEYRLSDNNPVIYDINQDR